MLEEAGERSDIFEQLDSGDIGPVHKWLSSFYTGYFYPQFTQSFASILIPYGIGVAGEVQVGRKPAHVRSSLIGKTLYEESVRIPDCI